MSATLSLALGMFGAGFILGIAFDNFVDWFFERRTKRRIER